MRTICKYLGAIFERIWASRPLQAIYILPVCAENDNNLINKWHTFDLIFNQKKVECKNSTVKRKKLRRRQNHDSRHPTPHNRKSELILLALFWCLSSASLIHFFFFLSCSFLRCRVLRVHTDRFQGRIATREKIIYWSNAECNPFIRSVIQRGRKNWDQTGCTHMCDLHFNCTARFNWRKF